MCTVKKHHSWIIYPLLANYEQSVDSIKKATYLNHKNKTLPVFEETGIKTQDLRKGLRRLLSKEDHNAKIGHVFSLKKRDLFQLPPRPNDSLYFYARTVEKPFEIYLKDMRIVLFESGVVFLMMRVDAKDKCSLDTCMNLMYYLCEPKDDKNYLEIPKKIWNAETKSTTYSFQKISLQQFISQFISYLEGDIELGLYIQDTLHRKPIIYSYLITNQHPQSHDLQNLARNYHSAYQLNNQSEHGNNILQVFSNQYWCASINGLCSLTVESHIERTDRFFDQGFEYKWESDYFFLFLNALHQKRSLIYLLNEIRQYNYPFNDYDMIENKLIEFQKTNELFSLFLLRCFFDVPSSVEHVNQVYNLIERAFNISEYENEFRSKFQSLIAYYDTITNRKKQIEEKQKEIKKKYIQIYVGILGTLVSILTIYASLIPILEYWIGETASLASIPSLILIVILIIPVITVAVNIINQLQEIKENKESIEKLKKLL